MSKKTNINETFIAAFTAAIQRRDYDTLMSMIDPAKYKDGSIPSVHRCRYLNHWKRVAALLTFDTNNTKGGSQEFQRLFTRLCSQFFSLVRTLDRRDEMIKALQTALQAERSATKELTQLANEQGATNKSLKETVETLLPRAKALEAVGDAIVQAGFAKNSAEVGSASGTAIDLIWQHKTALQELDEMRRNYLGACRTIAKMHAAAVGQVVGPKKGVVEDVSTAKRMADVTVNALLGRLGATAVKANEDGTVVLFFDSIPNGFDPSKSGMVQ